MWRTDTLWLDLAVFTSLTTVGSILFGHFEEHKPKWRRLLKVGLGAVLFVGVSAIFGRPYALALVVFALLGVAFIHLWWLPKHGIHGWTGKRMEK